MIWYPLLHFKVEILLRPLLEQFLDLHVLLQRDYVGMLQRLGQWWQTVHADNIRALKRWHSASNLSILLERTRSRFSTITVNSVCFRNVFMLLENMLDIPLSGFHCQTKQSFIAKPNRAPLNPAKTGLKPKSLVNSVLDTTKLRFIEESFLLPRPPLLMCL